MDTIRSQNRGGLSLRRPAALRLLDAKAAIFLVVVLASSCIHEESATPISKRNAADLLSAVAPHIVKCFHPTGVFNDAIVERQWIDDRVLHIRGKVYWQGLALTHLMTIEFRIDDREDCLVHVIDDDALFERDRQCALTNWTPMVSYAEAAVASKERFREKVNRAVKEFLDEIDKRERAAPGPER